MAKANIPIYRDMVELLKVLMREVKNMPKADNRTLGDSIINRTLNCIYQLQLAYDSHDNTAVRLQALNAFDTEFSTLCTYLRVVNELRLLSLKVEGRHNRPKGYIADLDKFNNAASLGWRVLKFTPQQQFTTKALRLVREALEWQNE